MEMKAIEVICLPPKDVLIAFSVRGSYVEHCALVGPLAITNKSFSAGQTKNITNLIIFTLQ